MTKRIQTDGVDITESVQILYDLAHSSMEWGSGMLDNAEMETVIRLAIEMGWQVPTLPDNSPAMLTVAAKFPEHYVVEEKAIPEQTTTNGHHFPAYVRTSIETRTGTHQ